MADTEEIQPLVCDNGSKMVKVSALFRMYLYIYVVTYTSLFTYNCCLIFCFIRSFTYRLLCMTSALASPFFCSYASCILLQAGFAGDVAPRAVYPSIVG